MTDPATPHVPPLSPEWPPSTDQLAEIAKAAHWQLDQLAYDLANRPHLTMDGRLSKIADDLNALAKLLRHHDTTQTMGN
jgi:hypothetical protein